jgi:antitoxin Phd
LEAIMAQVKRKTRTKPASGEVPSRKPPQKWQLQTAKAKFSEVFRRAMTEGPQHVTKAGKEEVVILSKEEFEKMTGTASRQKRLAQVLLESPLAGSGLKIERNRDYPRKIVL